MKIRNNVIVLLLLVLMLFSAGCGGEKKSEENRQEQKEMPRAITEIEKGLLSIMQQADLIPVTNRLSGQAQSKAANGAGEDKKKESSTQEKTLTFEETLLGELLQRESEGEGNENGMQEPPESTEAIWDNIKETITELHMRWNELEPLLTEEDIPPAQINYFEEGLDSLTVSGTEQNYFGTMAAANQLSSPLAKFMAPFAEKTISSAYELKFHVRNIVLQAAIDDYTGAQESLDYLKEQTPALANQLDKEEFKALETSLDNLQRVLQKQNLNLVVLNAAVVMENMVKAIENISQE